MRVPGSVRVPRARCSARAGATTGLSRATAICAAIFMINSLALAWLGTRQETVRSKALLDTAVPAQTVPAPAATLPVVPFPAAESPAQQPAEQK